MRKFVFLFCFLHIVISQARATATEIKLLTTNIPPYGVLQGEYRPGFITELILESFKRSDEPLRVYFLPWSRAQSMAKNTQGVSGYVIAPLTRTNERELSYDWILPLYSFQIQVFAIEEHVPIHNLDLLKEKAIICVIRESPALYKVKSLKFKKIQTTGMASQCFKMMLAGRVDAVFTHGMIEGYHIYQNILNERGRELLKGFSFPIEVMYLGASKGLISQRTKEKLNENLQKMKEDGTYYQILNKYGGRK